MFGGAPYKTRSAKEKAWPEPGLRMHGTFQSQSGLSLEFHEDSVIVGCGQALAAKSYAIRNSGAQPLVTIDNESSPITLTLDSDLSLSGSGSVRINGHAFVGERAGSDSMFAPASGTCTIGRLVSNSTQVRATEPQTSTPSTNTAPRPSTNTTLMISSGPRVASLLAGKTLVVSGDSLENVLARAGVSPEPRRSRISTWLHACETSKGSAMCEQGSNEGRKYYVNAVKLDGNGSVLFRNVPDSGTLYVFVRTKDQMWNLKVDLKPGANAIKLDESNMTPID
jgi:hypothetical protein